MDIEEAKNEKAACLKKMENLQLQFNQLNIAREKLLNEIYEIQGVIKFLDGKSK